MIEDSNIYTPSSSDAPVPDLEIRRDFSIPDFVENGRELWEHYNFEVEPGQDLLRIDKYLAVRIKGTSRTRVQHAAEAACGSCTASTRTRRACWS